MSLLAMDAIDAEMVTAVLLADGWHRVLNDSFDRFGSDPHTGFTFRTRDLDSAAYTIVGPLTSVLAMKLKRDWD